MLHNYLVCCSCKHGLSQLIFGLLQLQTRSVSADRNKMNVLKLPAFQRIRFETPFPKSYMIAQFLCQISRVFEDTFVSFSPGGGANGAGHSLLKCWTPLLSFVLLPFRIWKKGPPPANQLPPPKLTQPTGLVSFLVSWLLKTVRCSVCICILLRDTRFSLYYYYYYYYSDKLQLSLNWYNCDVTIGMIVMRYTGIKISFHSLDERTLEIIIY